MRRSRVVLAVAAILLFLCGVAVGQRAALSKFAKYQEPAFISRMDWLLMQARVDEIQGEVPAAANFSLRSIYFDSRTNKVRATALCLDEKRLELETVSSVRKDVEGLATFTEANIKPWIPELAQQDFEMEFDVLGGSKEKGKPYYVFADYRNGEVIVH
jgi:hypothetical protein